MQVRASRVRAEGAMQAFEVTRHDFILDMDT